MTQRHAIITGDIVNSNDYRDQDLNNIMTHLEDFVIQVFRNRALESGPLFARVGKSGWRIYMHESGKAYDVAKLICDKLLLKGVDTTINISWG